LIANCCYDIADPSEECDDQDICTADSCDTSHQCIHVEIEGCQAQSKVCPEGSIEIYGRCVNTKTIASVQDIIYAESVPVRFSRSILPLEPLIGYANEDIAALSWPRGISKLLLYAPNGTMISPTLNNSELQHFIGSTYDYYILRNASPGNWTLEVIPVEVGARGEDFTLTTGHVVAYQDR
jgi:hypothetical protein